MSSGERDPQTQARLRDLARPLIDRIKARRRSEAMRTAVQGIWAWCLFVPVAKLALLAFGVEWEFAVWVGLIVVVPLVVFCVRYLSSGASQARNAEREALCLLDDQLGLADRMSAAAEFLSLEARTPFMSAAIRDAEARIDQVAREHVIVERVPLSIAKAAPLYLLAAVALLFIELPESAQPELPPVDEVTAVGSPAGGDERNDKRTDRKDQRPDPKTDPDKKRATQGDPNDEGDSNPGIESEDEEASPRKSSSSAGRSSQTRSSGGRSKSSGQASLHSQASKAGEPTRSKPNKKKQDDAEEDSKPRKKQADEESGATVGRGSGRGSTKSPTSSPWTTKDQTTTSEEPELDDNEEVEDEFDQSDARGGVQPHLRSRKPPVNRDLQIGFGGGPPSPEANGRGGAGLPKKQRGVAQLVLGVHFPDHISGKPNPGMSKITQERIEPQHESSEAIAAADRGRRSSPLGPVARPTLLPWMQTFLRAFFESNRIAQEMEKKSGSR